MAWKPPTSPDIQGRLSRKNSTLNSQLGDTSQPVSSLSRSAFLCRDAVLALCSLETEVSLQMRRCDMRPMMASQASHMHRLFQKDIHSSPKPLDSPVCSRAA